MHTLLKSVEQEKEVKDGFSLFLESSLTGYRHRILLENISEGSFAQYGPFNKSASTDVTHQSAVKNLTLRILKIIVDASPTI